MKTTIISVGTVTYAIKARKALGRVGIRAKLVKINNKDTETGCEHAIEFSSNEFYDVINVLRSEDIPYKVLPNSGP